MEGHYVLVIRNWQFSMQRRKTGVFHSKIESPKLDLYSLPTTTITTISTAAITNSTFTMKLLLQSQSVSAAKQMWWRYAIFLPWGHKRDNFQIPKTPDSRNNISPKGYLELISFTRILESNLLITIPHYMEQTHTQSIRTEVPSVEKLSANHLPLPN